MLDLSSLPQLPAFDWQQQAPAGFDDYLNYYGIHFSQSLNHLQVGHSLGVMDLGGFDISVHYFSVPTPKGSVVLSHGYMDHVGLYNHLISFLLENGYNVLAYDLPGHGLSSGEQAGIVSFLYYQKVLTALLRQARTHLPRPWIAMGQSTGGSISMDYVLHQGDNAFDRLVLLAPLVIPKRWLGVRVFLKAVGSFVDKIPRGFPRNSSDEQFLDFIAHKDPLQTRHIKRSWVTAMRAWQHHFETAAVSEVPTLLIQGEQDVTVEWQYNLPAIRQHFSVMREVLLQPANHHLVNESEELRKEILAEINEFLRD